MRVVFDTNVLISALLFKRNVHWINTAIESKKVTPCFSKDTFQELARVLQYKKFSSVFDSVDLTAEAVLRHIASYAIAVEVTHEVTVIIDDPSDNMFLACAESAHADCIISGDVHITSLGTYKNIPIYTPVEARSLLYPRDK